MSGQTVLIEFLIYTLKPFDILLLHLSSIYSVFPLSRVFFFFCLQGCLTIQLVIEQVNVISYKTRPSAKDFIQVEIVVEKNSQKIILIGKVI